MRLVLLRVGGLIFDSENQERSRMKYAFLPFACIHLGHLLNMRRLWRDCYARAPLYILIVHHRGGHVGELQFRAAS